MAAHLTFKEREEFSRRLRTSLKNVGIDPNRPTQLLRAFCAIQVESSLAISTVSKWLSGEALPANGNMEVVARICNVSPHWLRSGHDTSG
ncbi:MAG: hypothetical protein LW709_04135 [Oxalobacteraceae bacterium]|jgi:hypothetical protein|nr:hypothetical protein [Oxalobacteraceae bacterium]